MLSRIFFPRPFAVTVERNGSAIGTIEVWGDSSTLIDYVRLGLLAGLTCLLITAFGTIFLARRFEYELVKPLNEIATVAHDVRSEEHTSELQSLMRISYAVFCLKKKKKINKTSNRTNYRIPQHRYTPQKHNRQIHHNINNILHN